MGSTWSFECTAMANSDMIAKYQNELVVTKPLIRSFKSDRATLEDLNTVSFPW